MEGVLNEKVPFIVVEESDALTEQKNRELIEKLRIVHPDIILVHFDSNAQKSYFKYFLDKGISKEVVDLLDFKGLSYGRVMNKQFLIAATFGADYVHRRDSDTKVADEFGFPSEMELKFLGRKVFEADRLLNDTNHNYNKDNEIYMVGSGYSGGGDWKIDYSLFLPNDSALIMEINKLLGYSDELSTIYYSEITTKSNVVREAAKYLPYENHSNPDCGNISFYKIHRMLPCPPMQNTTGTDYFAVNVLKSLEFPVVYHNHFVFHEFTPDRKKDNIDYAMNYWPRVVNLMDYCDAFAMDIFSKLKQEKDNCLTIEDADSKNLLKEFGEKDGQESIKRKEKIYKFGEVLTRAGNIILKDIGELLKTSGFQEGIIKNSNTGFENHKTLLELWPDLIIIAEGYNFG